MALRVQVGWLAAVCALLAVGMWPAAVEETAGVLTAYGTERAPQVDGLVEPLWRAAAPLSAPLAWQTEGAAPAGAMELRALYTPERVYFLARWPGQGPWGRAADAYNKLTVHWRMAPLEEAGQQMACTVACHVAQADGRGQFVRVTTQTAPQGPDRALEAAGGWWAGTWTLEWSRPLVSGSPYDVQFGDLEQGYPFLLKAHEGVDGWADRISPLYELRFGP
ncbi:MAG: hypothetical protein GX605_14010 [Chloroflexi bacterium]|nr:hypothetical protein [Chloroflexota bacterium]